MNEPTGPKRALDAAWDGLPKFLVAATLALSLFLGGLGWGYRELRADVDAILVEQATARLCVRITECGICQHTADAIHELRQSIIRSEGHIASHNDESIEWKNRIKSLEQKVYDIQTKPTARPDPFTGADGRELDQRIRTLERGRQ